MHSRALLTALSAVASLPAFAFAQGGPAPTTPYGCGLAPQDSLVLLSGAPAPGAVLTFGAGDPSGSMPGGALALLVASAAPDPSYPCGTPLPGFGLGGGTGELLVSLAAPHASFGPVVVPGSGQPASFSVVLPQGTSLLGKHVYFQGALVNVLTGKIGLTNGLDAFVPQVLKPDIAVRSVFVEPIPVAPGEVVRLHAIVENRGTASASGVEVEVCLGPAGCQLAVLPGGPLQPGANQELVVPFMTGPEWKGQNPHFASATADPNDSIDESNELDNGKQSKRPAFVVDVQYAPPAQVPEHDEIIVVQNGVKISHETIVYGPGGAPSESFEVKDPNKGAPQPGSVPDQPRIAPAVAEADASAQPGDLIEYIVKYEHGVPMPQLPPLPDDSGRFSLANIPALNARMALFEGTRRLRKAAAQQLVAELEQAGGEVVEHFALAGAMLVRAPKGYLAAFDQDPAVEHVEAVESAQPSGTVSVARGLMNTDDYYNSGATGAGYIAVIDTGVRSTHDLLSSPDHIFFAEDCVSGDTYCNDTGSSYYDPTYDEYDHGTSVAAIITGNDNYGNSYRGFTSSTIDSWKVHATGGGTSLSSTAIQRAFDQAVLWGDQIVNCSFGSDDGPSGTLAQSVDDMFDSGCAVFCANGNDGGGSGTVDAPACAHKAIGVGVYDVDSLADQSYQSDGPTSDDRVKPDLQAPTNSVTADASGDSSTSSFGGTSSGTPCVAGAASVLSDWFSWTSVTSANAGKIYATLINGGPRGYGSFDNTKGVGATELPLNGKLYCGSRTIYDGDVDSITIDVPSGATVLSCAIWWPEDESDTHRDIDLYLLKPSGSISTYSIDADSVFEHLGVSAPIISGSREVWIYGYDVPVGVWQTVYYAIFVEN